MKKPRPGTKVVFRAGDRWRRGTVTTFTMNEEEICVQIEPGDRDSKVDAINFIADWRTDIKVMDW